MTHGEKARDPARLLGRFDDAAALQKSHYNEGSEAGFGTQRSFDCAKVIPSGTRYALVT
jgi:hypothetical protein